jgi:hypothetical protein
MEWYFMGCRRFVQLQYACSFSALEHDRIGMKEEQQRFLSLLGQLPARLTAEQAGWVLNCQAHDIPALVNARLLKPLGNPSQNSTKYFAAADVLEMMKDRSWLAKVTNTISQHWQKQNLGKRDKALNGQRNGLSEMEFADKQAVGR